MSAVYYLFCLFSLCHASSIFSKEKTIPEGQTVVNQWITVPLDHFNLFDDTTWQMRFLENDEFFVENKPIFLEIGGESTLDDSWITNGPIYRLAAEHKGMLVTTEHRFYGKSLPFSTNFTNENLHFLQIEQALEDLAYFIDKYKNSSPKFKNSPVVIHGCSYPGMLATWMRLRFPNLVDIAYASSAPLGVGLDYHEYYEIVNDVYANVSVDCIDTIKQGFNETAELMKTFEGRKRVRDALEGWECGDPTKMNSAELLQTMMSVLNVQNDPLKYEELSCVVISIDSLDDNNTLKAFERLANIVVLKSLDRDTCAKTPVDESGETERNQMAWAYQTCTEMGTFQTLNRKNSKNPFAVDASVEESVEQCVNEFGGVVTEEVLRNGIERVTRRYGGKRPKVTKLVTVQGNKDPWRDLSSLSDYNDEAPVLLAQGSHCVDIAENEDDPEDILEIRRKVRNYINGWLSEIQK